MRLARVDWPGVHQAHSAGRVVWSEKEDACGATWVVEGTTCDGERLRPTVEVSCDRYRGLVTGVAGG